MADLKRGGDNRVAICRAAAGRGSLCADIQQSVGASLGCSRLQRHHCIFWSAVTLHKDRFNLTDDSKAR